MKRKNKFELKLLVILICSGVFIILVLGATENLTDYKDNETGLTKKKNTQPSDDPPPCYTVDRSRPEWIGGQTAIEDLPGEEDPTSRLPKEFGLDQSYPNPFNPTTTINFQVPKSASVTIKIFDMLGRQVRTLMEKDYKPGFHSIEWDGKDEFGRQVASGTYLYLMRAGNFTQVKKGTVLK